MTTINSPEGMADYVPPVEDDPYGLKHLAAHLPEQRKAEALDRLAKLRHHNHTEGPPP